MDADKEQNAAAATRSTLREEEQSLMAAVLPQITPQDRFSVRDPTAHRIRAGDLWCRNATSLLPVAGVAEPTHVGFEMVVQVRACG
jgi:hypothetical protein